MTTRDLIKLSTRMFKARTARTFLTILGMGIGIAAILFLVSLGYGIQRVLLDTITSSDSLLSISVLPNEAENKVLDASATSSIKSIPGVGKIVGANMLLAQIKMNDVVSDSSANITSPDFLSMTGAKFDRGKNFSESGAREIVVTDALAKTFNLDPKDMIGKEVGLSLFVPVADPGGAEDRDDQKTEVKDLEGTFKITGLIKSDDTAAYFSEKDLPGDISFAEYSQLEIGCAKSTDVDAVKSKLVDARYNVSSLSDTVAEVNKFFKIVNFILALFGVIALAVSAIGMFNTMTVALMERTQEIGIMKAVGVSNRDILRMFVTESTIMGLLGGIAGVAIGILGGQVFNLLIGVLAKSMGGKSMQLFEYPIWFLFLIVGLAVVVGFITGIVPARRASSIDPLRALQYK